MTIVTVSHDYSLSRESGSVGSPRIFTASELVRLRDLLESSEKYCIDQDKLDDFPTDPSDFKSVAQSYVKPSSKVNEPPSEGEIDPNKLYTLEIFKRVSGMGDWALRSARKNGLKMHQTGNRKFVKGQDFIDYLESLPAT